MHRLAALLALPLSIACVSADAPDHPEGTGHFHGEVDSEDPYYDELSDSLGTVAEQSLQCTTRGTVGLSIQIALEMNCMSSDSLIALKETDDIHFAGSAVLPLFAPQAIEDIYSAAELGPILITSGFRSIVQQHLIYGWYQESRCSIGIAARPGTSRHESGRAVDIRNWDEISLAMNDSGWTQPVAGDEIHFEHPDSADLRGLDVEAFQRLWNRNNPDDPIGEDGNYGDDTAEALNLAPAAGFAISPSCPAIDPDLAALAERALDDLPDALEAVRNR